jgi:hypothetical protein
LDECFDCKKLGDTNNHCRFWGWKNIGGLIDSLYLAYDSFKVKDVEVLAVIANKVQIENIKVTDGFKVKLA